MSSHTVQVAIYRVYLKIDKFIKIHFYIFIPGTGTTLTGTTYYYLVLTEMVHVGIITGSQVCTEVPL